MQLKELMLSYNIVTQKNYISIQIVDSSNFLGGLQLKNLKQWLKELKLPDKNSQVTAKQWLIVLNITLKAKEKLNQISVEKNIWPLQFLRLTIPPIWSGEGDFGIVIDNANEDDIQINFENKTILLIESLSLIHI